MCFSDITVKQPPDCDGFDSQAYMAYFFHDVIFIEPGSLGVGGRGQAKLAAAAAAFASQPQEALGVNIAVIMGSARCSGTVMRYLTPLPSE